MRLTKQDKQFMIQFDQNNRDFLSNISMFVMGFCVSIVSLLVATLAVIVAINGITTYSLVVAIIFGLIVVVFVVPLSLKIKKNIKNSFKINKQLQNKLYEVYPGYENKYR